MKSRIATMDSLRALSAIAVVISHTIPEGTALGGFAVSDIGDCGVILFFVLSAYLITTQLLKTKSSLKTAADIRPALSSFYANRALRLLPAFYVTLIVAALANCSGIRAGFWWYATCLTNVYFAVDPPAEAVSAAAHFWTIALEWQFYLIWPMLILLVPRRLVFWAIATAWLIGLYGNLPDNVFPEIFLDTGIPTYLDCLAAGAMLAYAQHTGWKMDRVASFVWPSLGLLLAGVAWSAWGPEDYGDYDGGLVHVAMTLFSLALIWTSVSNAFGGFTRKILEFEALSFVGMISYSLYLHHYFFIDLYPFAVAHGILPAVPEGLLFSALVMALATASAALSWFLIEKPIQRYRRRKLVPAAVV